MKPFLNIGEFLPFFNQENLVATGIPDNASTRLGFPEK